MLADVGRFSIWIGILILINSAAVAIHLLNQASMKFNDQVNDPWHLPAFYFYGLDGIFLAPIVSAAIMWTFYNYEFWTYVHLLVCLAGIIWAVFVLIHQWIDYIDRLNFTGLLPDVPWAISPNFPPDHSVSKFWIYANVTTSVCALCCALWLWIGLMICRAAKVSSTRSGAALLTSKIGNKIANDPSKAHLITQNPGVQQMRESWKQSQALNKFIQAALEQASMQSDFLPEGQQIMIGALYNYAMRVGYKVETFENYFGLAPSQASHIASLSASINGDPHI